MTTKERRYQGGGGIRVCEKLDRCIHARACVTGLSQVFIPNAPGPWINPNAASRDAIIATIARCPSGALNYETTDGTPGEQAPTVNTVRIQEDGPLEFRGDLTVQTNDGPEKGFRMTLCRCGHSKKKPFCDRSHADRKFKATGEPGTTPSEALVQRDGPLSITMEKNGPLIVRGNVEVIAGSGHTVDRKSDGLRLCRCGLSDTRPYCDGSHAREGFVDE